MAHSLQKTIQKLERAQRKFGYCNKKAAKIKKFKTQLEEIGLTYSKSSSLSTGSSSGGNNPRSGSVKGIEHFRGWLQVFKSKKNALRLPA